MLPERWLNERFSVPEREVRSPMSSGIGPWNSLVERSSWTRFSSSGQMPVGISPENLFRARISRWSCLQFLRSPGMWPEKELSERSRFWRRGTVQTEAGKGPERLLRWRKMLCNAVALKSCTGTTP